jgi:hypothetical protein
MVHGDSEKVHPVCLIARTSSERTIRNMSQFSADLQLAGQPTSGTDVMTSIALEQIDWMAVNV